ncbi:chaperonin-containing T-complex eta subunit Cct7 [Binucleata daphniae]
MNIEQQIDNRQGISQILSNIKLLEKVATYLRTTLGPFGLDKLIVKGKKTLITNDGATIMKNMNFNHPAAKLMKSISMAQDEEVGDGTTSVVLLTVEILKSLEDLIKIDSIETINETLEDLLQICMKTLNENKINVPENAQEGYLQKMAKTALTSKILKHYKEDFANYVTSGLKENENLIIKKIKGGSIEDSFLFQGVAFEKCFTYAGYEQQPKKIMNPQVLLTNVELEWKSERENAEMRIKNVEEYQNIVDAEWKIIKDKLDFIVGTGAKVVLSSLVIGDYATQYFARFGIFCAGRVSSVDMNKIKECSGAKILSSLTKKVENNNISDNVVNNNILGKFDMFEERQIGNVRYNFLLSSNSCTLILRGPGDEILNEMERSLNDAIIVVKKNMNKEMHVVTGGGSNEMAISIQIRKESKKEKTQKMFIYHAIAQAFENYVIILAKNFGKDSLAVLAKLRTKHNEGGKEYGVANNDALIADMNIDGVYEPYEAKKSIIVNAFNAVKTILMIDSTLMLQTNQ